MRQRISRKIGRFRLDRRLLAVLVLMGLALAGRSWLEEHPQHNPWAPLDLRDPPGWATQAKLRALHSDVAQCRAVLQRSEIEITVAEPAGEGECLRNDRTRLGDYPLTPGRPETTCPVAIAMVLWQREGLDAAAQDIFGAKVLEVEHLGAYSCRRMYGRDEGPWSEHATGNAIDIAGFALSDGTRISVLRDWDGDGDKARFLHRVRDEACGNFATVLSPDYNAAHADHLHLDMSDNWRGICR